jgi:short-subunit dehydrogenase
MRSLRNSTVVITGASSGIGKAAALAFARKGANLVLAARRDEPLRDVAHDCESLGVEAITVVSDVRELDDMEHLAARAVERFGGIDVWINNAGIGLVGPFADVPMESHRQVIETNLFGTMNGTHAVLPHFLEQGSGTLITNISFGAWVAPPFAAAYAASKFGMEGFTQSLRMELLDWPDIHVCDVFPAVIDTPGYAHGGNYMGKELKPGSPILPPERVADAMVGLALHPRRGVSVGAMAPLTKFAHTIAPALTEAAMARGLRRYFRRAAPAPYTHGALFRPVPQGTGASGGYREQASGSQPLLLAGLAAAGVIAAGMLYQRRS